GKSRPMNRREKQRQVREAKQQAERQRQQRRQIFGRLGLFVALPALALLVVWVLATQGPTYSPVEVAPNDHIRGDPETPVSIVVYTDFQCPACATENQLMARIWSRIEDRAHLISRHYPLTASNPHAWTAALYAEAAGRQGRFWEMHDFLFANQAAWSFLPEVETEFESYAENLDIDIEQLRADVASEAVIAKVRDDQRGGNSAGVRSTPAVFINGERVAQLTGARILDRVAEQYQRATAGS
ncbi:MAG: thioredoxin domain-containing protein, partial [Gammaproteobacteria bacterium]|nr:thioredoxin domain-containing protein [Gammaproteobacteria bacterium]MCY4270911.1 thioredoxin domain-containing protein [Gammaproteobacteria bacterium]